MDVLECQEQNGLVSFKQNFLTPNDDGGGLDPTNWGGTTYEHTYSPLEEDCVHFHPNLKVTYLLIMNSPIFSNLENIFC